MRYYYTDPVAAAYMTAHHKIRFKRNDDLREWGRTNSSYSAIIELCIDLEDKTPGDGGLMWKTKLFPDEAFSGKFYIHPDSLPLLEPRVGDIVMDFRPALIVREDHLIFHKESPILQRDGKPFHWPESEAA